MGVAVVQQSEMPERYDRLIRRQADFPGQETSSYAAAARSGRTTGVGPPFGQRSPAAGGPQQPPPGSRTVALWLWTRRRGDRGR